MLGFPNCTSDGLTGFTQEILRLAHLPFHPLCRQNCNCMRQMLVPKSLKHEVDSNVLRNLKGKRALVKHLIDTG
jgi:hypothetical protein